MNYEEVRQLIKENALEAASALLPSADSPSATATDLYLLGRIAWKEGRKTDAMSLYGRATALDPDSEAATALEQARVIMGFYHRDLYNP